jgi:spermidine synthase
MKYLIPVLCCLISFPIPAKDIHVEKSLYRNIVVRDQQGLRCLLFTVKQKDQDQSCMNLADPRKLVLTYVRMSFAGLLLNGSPQSILVVGLGGGTIPVAIAELVPESTVDVVEIDAAVVNVARRYFDFVESDRMKVHVSDARVYIKRAAQRNRRYDMVILDAYNGDYIPEHLMTREFLEETRSLLTDSGVVVANTFSRSDLYDHESVTFHEVFGDFLNFKLPDTDHRVILASMKPLPSLFMLRNTARQFRDRLLRYDVQIENYPRQMSRTPDWDQDKRALTDQYSPANLLQRR